MGSERRHDPQLNSKCLKIPCWVPTKSTQKLQEAQCRSEKDIQTFTNTPQQLRNVSWSHFLIPSIKQILC